MVLSVFRRDCSTSIWLDGTDDTEQMRTDVSNVALHRLCGGGHAFDGSAFLDTDLRMK